MNQETLTKLIKKMIKLIKPKDVLSIEFKLEPMYSENEYYMMIQYVVPDDSEFLRSANMRTSDNIRRRWNEEIKNSIQNYFDVRISISSSGVTAKSYYDKLKPYFR